MFRDWLAFTSIDSNKYIYIRMSLSKRKQKEPVLICPILILIFFIGEGQKESTGIWQSDSQ